MFDVIDSREAYHLALGTTHFGALVKHLISKDAINGLLTKTVTAGRLADAARLVRSYSLAHASKPAAEAVAELGEQAEGRSRMCYYHVDEYLINICMM